MPEEQGGALAPEASSAVEESANGQPTTLAAALLAFQADPPQLIREAEAEVRGISRQGKEFSYTFKYLDLPSLVEAMRPKLTSLGLLWQTKAVTDEQGKAALYYCCTHVPSGQEDDGTMPLLQA